ncbi:MAG: glycyl-radical enzyme activating protein [Ruminococcaceae bacterium]|nr:glycyl-radical enzyme activating protein [Oscillospiraceae bacterium]
MNANIFEIKRFAVHDGDGIRTTVFFKGCPLKCVWCHNPEGISSKPELALYQHKCTLCGQCVRVCPAHAHKISDGVHSFNNSLCISCKKCTDECFNDALKFYGKEVSVEELLESVLEDREFYESSGGGVTLSGGECLMQSEFCCEFLKALKSEGISTAVDTSGFATKDALDKVIPYTDIFLYDIKAIDEDVHIKCTGQSNKIILDNLKYIDEKNVAIEVRIPFVPGYNDEEMEKIGAFLKEIKNLKKIRVLPYHNLAASKYDALNMKNALPEKVPGKDEVQKIQYYLEKMIGI